MIPTYNYGRYIGAAVDGVLAQTYRPIEVIVVDDGSKDDTRQRLEPYRDRIRYVYQENQGPEFARNTGIHKARGELIAFLDPDDAWIPHKLTAQVNVITSRPDVWLVCSDAVSFTDTFTAPPPAPQPAPVEIMPLEAIYLRNKISTSSVMVRTEQVRELGGFRPNIRSEDWDLWLRIARHGKIARIREPLFGRREHAENRSTNVTKELPWALQVIDDNCAGLPETFANWRLRRQSRAVIYYTFAYLHCVQGRALPALGLITSSFLSWPLPLPSDARKYSWERLRFLARIVRSCGARA